MTVEALVKALQREADRRAKLEHYQIAHELRTQASQVRRAESSLRYSKRVPS